MVRKQNLSGKFLLTLGLLLVILSLSAQISDPDATLQLADSLYAQEKYTESLELYEELLKEDQLYTPGMLMKMAFINEGLGRYSEALYLLNLFYAKTSDKRALRKMEELAKQHHLNGYQFNDLEFFRTTNKRYHLQTVAALGALSLFIFSFILYQKRQGRHRPVSAGIMFVMILAILFGLINFGQGRDRAIILADRAYLRTGPSSGANVAEIIEKGHRVEIMSQQDVWIKINWNNRPLYIRESHLGIIES
jgi:tetratricopeptide (TPR) repeat protein